MSLESLVNQIWAVIAGGWFQRNLSVLSLGEFLRLPRRQGLRDEKMTHSSPSPSPAPCSNSPSPSISMMFS